MRILFITIFSLILTFSAFADAPNGLAFLKICTDVRTAAMGEAGVAAGNPASASFYNPALLAHTGENGLGFSHHRWIQDIKMNHLFAYFKTGVRVGISALATGVNDIEIRSTPSPEPIELTDSYDISVGLHLAYPVTSRFGIGFAAKFLNEHIYYADTQGFAFDFGASYLITDRLRVAAALMNAGQMNELDQVKPYLPWTVRTGAAYELPLDDWGTLQAAGEVRYIREEDVRGGVGLEWRPRDLIALRGGYLAGYDERGMTLGLGLYFSHFRLDYAYVPVGDDLGTANRFGLTVVF